jgi:hypothetical protein
MARLPKPGADSGTWGTVLNDFLSVELNSDGTLKKAADISAATQAAAAAQAKADAAAPSTIVVHNTTDETIAGIKTFSSAPVVPTSSFPESAVTNLTTDLSAKIDKATATTKGDLLAATAVSTITRVGVGVGTDGQILTADAASSPGVKWATPTAAPVTSVVGQTGIITGSQIASDPALTATYASADQRNQVLSIEDQENHIYLGTIDPSTITGSIDYPLMVVQGACEIRSLHLLSMSDVAASATNYWTFSFRRQRSLNVPPAGPAATSEVLSAPDTTLVGGKSMNAGVPWSCMWRFWDFTKTTCAEEDVILLRFIPTGTPPVISRLLVSVRTVAV